MIRSLVLGAITAVGTGCSLIPPQVACPDPAVLSQADCARAVRIATAVLPPDARDFTTVNVERRCTPDPSCPRPVGALVLRFSASNGSQVFVRIYRDTWRAEVFTPTPPPAPGPAG